MNVPAKLREWDPDLLNLRKATRVTLVAIPLLAVLKVWLDLGPLSTFAFFACFVGIVFANFGGPRRPRALAYIAMIIICDIVIIIGSLLTDTVIGGTAAMFIIMFTASFAAVFGGYTPAFVAPVALAYSLAVLDPLSNLAIDIRVLGWSIGGAMAMIAGLVLWPVDRRVRLRHTLADASAGFADALAAIDDKEAAEAAYGKAVEAMADARSKVSEPQRPAGPMVRDVGLLHLVEHLEQTQDMTRRVLDGGWNPDADKQLIGTCAEVLRQTSAMLMGKISPVDAAQGLPMLEEALLARRHTVDVALTQAAPSHAEDLDPASEALATMRRSFPIMALSHIVMWVHMSAARALGATEIVVAGKSTPEVRPVSDRPQEIFGRMRTIVMGGLDPDGVIFRNSIRAAAALSLAVILAQVLPVEHGFWVTLAALLVLRSSAASTSTTVLQALVGTLGGFAVGVIFLLLFGNDSTAMWILLPFVVFLAAYTPGVVSFIVGQVSFSAMVLVLFALVDPEGFTTDLMRVETVVIGSASGVVMGLILWPRGARPALARAVANLYRAASEGTRTLVTGSPEDLLKAKSNMYSARRHADEAFGVALGERGWRIDTHAWITLSRAPTTVHSLVIGVIPPMSSWLGDHCAAAMTATVEHRNRVADTLDQVADRLDPKGARPTQQALAEPTDDLIPALMDCFTIARPFGPDMVEDARLLIAWNEWLSFVDDFVAGAESDLDQVVAASKPGAWIRWSTKTTKTAPHSTG